ncbi:MAG: hypothetical protein LBP28_00310 [Coriobacteriales bacterium]|nr:hypothetical protein [Coriobacteriales bacterium]
MTTQMTAVQSMLVEYYADNGGIKTYTEADAPADALFKSITPHASGADLYSVGGFTPAGIQAYAELTGDSDSFGGRGIRERWFGAIVDPSGTIQHYAYNIGDYFKADGSESSYDVLAAWYEKDLDSTDPAIVTLKEYFSKKKDGLEKTTSGFNFYRYYRSTSQYEKLN